MSLSEQLQKAIKIYIFPGQFVTVRTQSGDDVAEGHVEEVDAERGLVRVRNDETGTEVWLDVDTTRYDLWVRDTSMVSPEYGDTGVSMGNQKIVGTPTAMAGPGTT